MVGAGMPHLALHRPRAEVCGSSLRLWSQTTQTGRRFLELHHCVQQHSACPPLRIGVKLATERAVEVGAVAKIRAKLATERAVEVEAVAKARQLEASREVAQ